MSLPERCPRCGQGHNVGNPCPPVPGLANCGHDHTCSGWVVRNSGYHIATFRRETDADEYVRVFRGRT